MEPIDERRLRDRAFQAVADSLQPLGFRRTKPTYLVRLGAHVVEFVHLHKFTFGRYLRVHLGIRVLNSPYDSIALNGPDSDSVARWLPVPTGMRKYNVEYEDNERSIEKCASTVRKFATGEGERWFSKWRDLENLARHPKSPLAQEDREALINALSGDENQQRIDASKKLLGLLLALVMLALYAGCTQSKGKSKPQPTKPKIQRNEAIKIASKQARQLGYDSDKMTVECERTANEFVIDFVPPKDQLGGDLTVKIDASTGKVMEVLRGQ